MARRRRRRSGGGGKIIALAAVVVVAVTVLVLLNNGVSSSLKSGSMEARFTQEVVLIRDESSIPVDKFDQVDYQVSEGALVNAEMPVALVYKWGYTDEMTQSLVTIQSKIYNKQLEILDGIQTAELTALNAQIADLQKRIQETVSGESEDDLLQLETEIKGLIAQRAEYLKNSVQPDVDLTALYDEETAKLNQIAEYASTVSAKMTGQVSFYFDGYEQVLNADKLDVLNAGLVNNIISGDHVSDAATNTSLLYRMVNPTKWYVAFVTPASQGLRLQEGQTYSVVFDGLYDKPYIGTAHTPGIYDGGILNLLEFSEDIGKLLSARVVGATITAEMTGFEADVDAVKVKDGKCSIETSSGEREVAVVAASEDGETVLITGNGLAEGLKYER